MEVTEPRPRGKLGLIVTVLLFSFMVILMTAFLLTLFSKQGKQDGVQVGTAAPDFTFPDLNGKRASLSGHRGKVVLVNIWATWCHTCVWEMPSMQKLYERFSGENFEILAVSIDSEGHKVVAPFMRKYNLTFPVLLDLHGTIRSLYATTGVPESFIIDKEGILVRKIIGPLDWATPEVFRFFQDLIQR